MTKYEEALKIMDKRFGHDTLISVGPLMETVPPFVR